MSKTSFLEGRRAVYARIDRTWSKEKNEYVETGRKLFRGTIAALTTSSGHPVVVMLYDDGSLRAHAIDNVTVEAEPAGYRDPPKSADQ